MGKFIDLTGEKFGRLTVVSRNYKRQQMDKRHEVYWNCLCDCGNPNLIVSTGGNLKRGAIKSCGCLNSEQRKINGKKNKKYITFDLESEEYGIGIMLNGEQFYFDKEDYEKIKDICWNKQKGYISGLMNGKSIRLHRLILDVPKGCVVDHINHKKYDNRKENLRICKQHQNTKNRKINKNNTSGVTGVYFSTKYKKWCAAIKVNYKKINLGMFDNIDEAITERKRAEKEYFGEYRNIDI